MTLNNLMMRSSNAGALGNAEYPFIAIALLCQLGPGVAAPDRVLAMDQIQLNRVLPLN